MYLSIKKTKILLTTFQFLIIPIFLPTIPPTITQYSQREHRGKREFTTVSLSLSRGEQRLNADLADPGAYLEGHSIRASVIIVVIRRVTTVRSLRLPSLNPGSWTSWLPFSARFPLRRQKVGAEIRNKSPGDFDRNPSGLITDGLARIFASPGLPILER